MAVALVLAGGVADHLLFVARAGTTVRSHLARSHKPSIPAGVPLGPFTLASVDRRCFYAPSPARNWPVAPIHRAHPIRGGLNDPRGVSPHFGVDVESPNRAPVYAVAAGVVAAPEGARGPQALRPTQFAVVTPGSNQRFSYWHVTPVAVLRIGDHVAAGELIGHDLPGFDHVHLSEWEPGCGWVDPRRPTSVLRDPADIETPAIGSPSAFGVPGGAPVPLGQLHGIVDLRAAVSDTPRDRTRLRPQLPLMPAAVRAWFAPAGRPSRHLGRVTVFDGATVMSPARYRATMAPGTRRTNGCLYHADLPCAVRFVFHLTGAGFDTRALPDGGLLFCVQALTIEGRSSRRCATVRITNR